MLNKHYQLSILDQQASESGQVSRSKESLAEIADGTTGICPSRSAAALTSRGGPVRGELYLRAATKVVSPELRAKKQDIAMITVRPM